MIGRKHVTKQRSAHKLAITQTLEKAIKAFISFGLYD